MQSDRPSARSTDRPSKTPIPGRAISEDLFLRNYDPYAGYDLTVTVLDSSGDTVFDESYYFRPGQIESVYDALDPGEYVVTAELDNRRRKTAEIRVSSAPDHTIHVEIGNGIVSLTEGLYG